MRSHIDGISIINVNCNQLMTNGIIDYGILHMSIGMTWSLKCASSASLLLQHF